MKVYNTMLILRSKDIFIVSSSENLLKFLRTFVENEENVFKEDRKPL